ncbi:peptidase inhibitor family I36 protein [Streptomyces sp. NPDC004549]|uniref:peptidase inhibitor family I36 protein n=1 Tax=unclassified Streptomyces TaxID=2593676 RepID=UPI0018F4E46B|nr:peptidase inhibitor family I36 protein [Streptomyces sp. DSM 110735]MBJ7902225.1 peptidase inhibitor family I36 protein [Streptomyces sp. DSM 110735]
MRSRWASFALVVGTVVAATLGTSTQAQALPGCPSNATCLWRGEDGTGESYIWRGGYVDLPSRFVDHVGSFRANRAGSFIDYADGKECRLVRSGDYAAHYQMRFGGEMDALGDSC